MQTLAQIAHSRFKLNHYIDLSSQLYNQSYNQNERVQIFYDFYYIRNPGSLYK